LQPTTSCITKDPLPETAAKTTEAEVAKSRAAILLPTMWQHVLETAIVRSF